MSTSLSPDITRLWELANALCLGDATDDDLRELETLLTADEQNRRRYLAYCRLHAALGLEAQAQRASGIARKSTQPADVAPVTAPASPVLGFLGSAYHGVSGYIGDHEWAQGILGGTVFLALLFAVLGSIEIFSRWRLANRPQPQDNQVVDVPAVRAAQLTGVFDCRWTGSFHPPRNEVLNVDDYINLASGLAEVTYDSGAKVLLQGPCTYKIESPSSGYLKVGRLTARVGSKLPSPGTDRRLVGRGAGGEGGGAGNEELGTKKEELPAPTSSILLPTSSFVVNTPTATVTDLGTEFGVDVDKQGTTDSLVFVGSVKVHTVVGDGQKQASELTLIENQSARVERQGGKQYVVRRAAVKPDGFVRPDQIQEWLAMAREAAAKRKMEAEKPKEPPPVRELTLDLADIVCGGNGTHGRLGHGINQESGCPEDQPSPSIRRSDGKFHPVTWNSLIDGMFIPGGSGNPVPLDSAGHVFDGFPHTTGTAYGAIFAGLGSDQLMAYLVAGNHAKDLPKTLYIHANAGVTFPLGAIPERHPGWKAARFRAKTYNLGVDDGGGTRVSADVWVFVDGQPRFSKTDFNAKDGTFDVDIPLAPADHFLTLVATDAGNGIANDGIVFEEPRIELTPEKSADVPVE